MLKGKVALVTGGGRGIGRAISLGLAKEGAFVVVNYNGSGEKAQETVRDIQAAGGEAQAYGCNVADFNACGAMMAELTAKYGHIDILVNNAGITRDGLMAKMSEIGRAHV